MKINPQLKNKINKCVVRIVAEVININWELPYSLSSPARGQGTGFFINKDGYILTCAHVVDSAKIVYIEIPNVSSDKYECSVVGICPKFDIALLKCDKYKSKEYLELGDSDKLEVGSEVQVVGYPASLTKSSRNSNNLKFTVGIIGGQQSGFIQTDSAINPGNSGGPLFSNNKVIGINSQKLVGESLENIGYAIPINNYKTIKDNFDNLIIHRPSLLFEYNNTDKDFLNDLTNGKINQGIIISKIYNESILKKSKLKENYILTKIDRYKLDNYGLTIDYKWLGTNINIQVLLNKLKNNSNIKLEYYNTDNNKLESCNVILKPFLNPLRILYPAYEEIPYLIFGGIVFSNLSQNYIVNSNNKDFSLICLLNNTEESLKPKLCITTILNKKINILKNISKNNIINKVNDINVNCVNDLEKALKKCIIINNKKYIKIQNSESKYVIISMDELYEEDLVFSKIYNYKISNLYKNK
jgi:serine protease Do